LRKKRINHDVDGRYHSENFAGTKTTSEIVYRNAATMAFSATQNNDKLT
jgi:hypothetical protein